MTGRLATETASTAKASMAKAPMAMAARPGPWKSSFPSMTSPWQWRREKREQEQEQNKNKERSERETTMITKEKKVKTGKKETEEATLTVKLLLSAKTTLVAPPPLASVLFAWPRLQPMHGIAVDIKRFARPAP